MRAFHCAWWGFFCAFFLWFAIAPLQNEVKKTLHLTKKDLWTASIAGVSGTVVMRFILGPLCDKFGPRVLFAFVLGVASIPTACTGFVNSANGLIVLRLFIGIGGGTFVMCQYWASRMFTKDIVGTANAIVAGWGNLGGGVTQLIMGSALFPLFKLFFHGNSEKAWRTVCVVPAVAAFASGVMIYFISDDAPKGNYSEMKKHGTMAEVSAAASFRSGAVNVNSWILFFQYACCFGVELTMDNAAALYFTDKFGQSTASAAAIASIFGWLNLFARGLGGYFSDFGNRKLGMRGRLLVQTAFLLCEGALILIFANTNSLGGAIAVLVFFALFNQGTCGATYGIVPYVDPPVTGAVSGIVGAGGNAGAIGFGLAFRQLNYKEAFVVMGCTVLGSSLLSFLIVIKGHAGLVFGKDAPVEFNKNLTLSVPEPDTEVAAVVNAEADKEDAELEEADA